METEYILCEHIESYDPKDIVWNYDPYYHFSLGRKRTLLLCNKCRNSVAYDMVTQFNKDSTTYVIPSTPYVTGR